MYNGRRKRSCHPLNQMKQFYHRDWNHIQYDNHSPENKGTDNQGLLKTCLSNIWKGITAWVFVTSAVSKITPEKITRLENNSTQLLRFVDNYKPCRFFSRGRHVLCQEIIITESFSFLLTAEFCKETDVEFLMRRIEWGDSAHVKCDVYWINWKRLKWIKRGFRPTIDWSSRRCDWLDLLDLWPRPLSGYRAGKMRLNPHLIYVSRFHLI